MVAAIVTVVVVVEERREIWDEQMIKFLFNCEHRVHLQQASVWLWLGNEVSNWHVCSLVLKGINRSGEQEQGVLHCKG